MVESDNNEDEYTAQQKLENNITLNEVAKKSLIYELSDAEKNKQNEKVYIDEILNTKEKSNLSSLYVNGKINVSNLDNGINKKNNIKENTGNKNKNSKSLSKYDKRNISSDSKKDAFDKEDNKLIKNDINDPDKNNTVNKKKEDKMVDKATEKNFIEDLEKFNIKFINTAKANDTEIINGVELIVECASDQEFCEENEKEEKTKSRSKTIIIREKPNDSEVDASSSETEKSESYKIIEAKTNININVSVNTYRKQTKKRYRNKSIVSKIIDSESENSTESNFDDEDYSPIAKKKVKKFSSKKISVKSTEMKRGRGRPRGRPPKIRKIGKGLSTDENEVIKETTLSKYDEKYNNNISEVSIESKNLNSINKSKNASSENEVFDDSINNDRNNSNSIKNENKKKSSEHNIKKIDKLKRFIRTAGIKVHCYQTLFKDCKSNAAKAKCLHGFLEKNGIVGKPTLDKCKQLRIKNDTTKV